MVDSPSAQWRRMHDKYYRNEELFLMGWQHVDLEMVLEQKVLVAVARNGGPVAMVRDDTRKVLRAAATPSQRPTVRVFTSSGTLLAEFVAGQNELNPIKLGWTHKEELVCVMENGTVLLYSVHGDFLRSFALGKEVQLNGMQEVHILSTGLVVLMFNKQLVAIADYDDPEPTVLAAVNTPHDITAVAVMDPQFTAHGGVEVFLATSNGSIIVVDHQHAIDQQLSSGPFSLLSVSPNGKILAGFSNAGKLTVMLSNFAKHLSEVDFQTSVTPVQLVWCGVDAVVLYWHAQNEHVLMLVGPYEDNLKYVYDDPLLLVPEVDGVRIFSNYKCEFLQLVPKCLEDIFRVGSMADSAILYDAWKQFQSHSSKADENVRSIQPTLADAVDACVVAAGNEFSVGLQKDLMYAASYGKCSCDWYSADTFVDMCRTLRVLNTVRQPHIGRPLTLRQYEALTVETLIAHLVSQHLHHVALNICKHMKLGNAVERTILVHWACAKIKASDPKQDPAHLRDLVVAKLRECQGISYAKVAATAHDYGHTALAAAILDHEARATEQVPLLISWGKEEAALAKAVASGDTDLVYLALLHMKDRVPEDQFFAVVAAQPLASHLLVAYCKEMDLKHLQSFYYAHSRLEEAGHVLILEAYKKDDLRDRVNGLEIALKFFEKGRDLQFAHKATQEQIRLLKVQVELTVETDKPFVDMSLSDTIFACFEFGKAKKAADLAKEFKVPDKRFWHLKVKALAHFAFFDELEKFAAAKKSPIGYQPFFDACVEQGRNDEAEKYVARLADAQAKARAYVELQKYAHAADVATTAKDQELAAWVEQMRARRR